MNCSCEIVNINFAEVSAKSQNINLLLIPRVAVAISTYYRDLIPLAALILFILVGTVLGASLFLHSVTTTVTLGKRNSNVETKQLCSANIVIACLL